MLDYGGVPFHLNCRKDSTMYLVFGGNELLTVDYVLLDYCGILMRVFSRSSIVPFATILDFLVQDSTRSISTYSVTSSTVSFGPCTVLCSAFTLDFGLSICSSVGGCCT